MLGRQLQPLEISKWKWENLICDLLVGLPKTKKNKDDLGGSRPTHRNNSFHSSYVDNEYATIS